MSQKNYVKAQFRSKLVVHNRNAFFNAFLTRFNASKMRLQRIDTGSAEGRAIFKYKNSFLLDQLITKPKTVL
jgi:hypothetical protein